MSVLNSDVLYLIFDSLRLPAAGFYRDATVKDTRFYRAMLAVGLSPPLPTGDDLSACALVCRTWRGPAQCIMRRHLRIPTAVQCRHFISVTSNPDVGRGIHSLDLTLPRKGWMIPSDVIALLHNCPKLQTLRVEGFLFTEEIMAVLSASNTVFSHLTALDLGWGTSFDKSILGSLLDIMPRLQVLAIGNILEEEGKHSRPPACRLQSLVPYKLSPYQYSWLLDGSQDTLYFLSPAVIPFMPENEPGGFHAMQTALRSCGALEWLSFDHLHHASIFINHCPRVAHLRLPCHAYHATRLSDTFDAMTSSISTLLLFIDPTLKPQHVLCLIEDITHKPVLSQLQTLALEFRSGQVYSALPVDEIQTLNEVCKERGIAFRCPNLSILASPAADLGEFLVGFRGLRPLKLAGFADSEYFSMFLPDSFNVRTVRSTKECSPKA